MTENKLIRLGQSKFKAIDRAKGLIFTVSIKCNVSIFKVKHIPFLFVLFEQIPLYFVDIRYSDGYGINENVAFGTLT